MKGPLIVRGDFNCVLDSALDRSKGPLPSDRRISAAMHEFQTQLSIIDVWRTVNPESRKYTFYSNPHNSYSRIDCILMSSNLIQNVIDTKMNSILCE